PHPHAPALDPPSLHDALPIPSTTTPAPSWPRTAGNTPSGSSPDNVKASVWHTPVWVILMSTSPLRGGSTSISTISRGFPASKARSEEHTSELQSRENIVCRLL